MKVRNTKKNVSRLLDFTKSFEYVKEVKNLVRLEFEAMKKELIQEFETHPVTVEIDGGKNARNLSGTLDGVENLFSYIGFEENDKPTQPIRNALNEIFLTSTMIKKDGSSLSNVLYPLPDDIFRITPMPWAEGRSWAKGIESGMPGFGRYLRKDAPSSRSGGGIQVKGKVRAGGFKNTRYISEMIRKFEKNLRGLNRITI